MLRRELIRQGAGAALIMFGVTAYPSNVLAEPSSPANPFFIEANQMIQI